MAAEREIDLNVLESNRKVPLKVDSSGPIPMTLEQVRIIYDSPYPPYTGPTIVTPEIDAQLLPTQKTLVLDDIIIRAIPYYETSNPSGGYTAIIGG